MRHIAVTSVSLLSAIAALPAMAEDGGLPGVSQPDAIVTTLPPEPGEDGQDPKSFRIGNTEVRISGEITVDVTVGDIKRSPRR